MKHAFLLLLALVAPALCLSRTSAQAPPSPPLTGKIAHLTILGTKNIPVDTVRAVLTQKPGDAYTPEAAAKDAATIKGMGIFNAVSIAAAPSPVGIDLTYTVEENPVVTAIKFTADTPTGQPLVPATELIAQMKTRIGQVMNTTILVGDLDKLFNVSTGYYGQRGYVADVSTGINIEPKTGIITIPLKEFRIQSIQIAGNSRVKTADILTQMHTKAGDIYDGNVLNEDLYCIYEAGQFKTVENFKANSVGPERLSITIPVVEHPAATGTLDEKQGTIIPFLYDPITVPYPVVYVSVNGKPPLPFIVDTGTNAALSLNPWAAKQLGLTSNAPVEKAKGGFSFSRVPLQSVVLQGDGKPSDSNAAFGIKEAFIIDLNAISKVVLGQHIAGIVGLGMLEPVTSRFDFAAKTLTIFSAPHAPLNIPGGTVLPLRAGANGLVTVHATLAPKTYADLILDTGSTVTQIPLSALGAAQPTATSYDNCYGMITGFYISPEARLSKLMFHTLTVPNVVVGVVPPTTTASLSLGMDILAGYRLTLDGPNGQLVLEPAAHRGRYVSGWSGIDIKQSGSGWSVSELRTGSPARHAGLQVGDKIIVAYGINIKDLSKEQVERLLSGLSGKPVQVKVSRKPNHEAAISWVSLDDFSAPHTAMDGLSMEKANSDPWVVTDILKDCPGNLAQMQTGDTIIQVGGEDTASMTLDRYGELIEKPLVVLKVERAGLAKPFTVRLSVPK